eukprot:519342-Amphidinium_carterae.1
MQCQLDDKTTLNHHASTCGIADAATQTHYFRTQMENENNVGVASYILHQVSDIFCRIAPGSKNRMGPIDYPLGV